MLGNFSAFIEELWGVFEGLKLAAASISDFWSFILIQKFVVSSISKEFEGCADLWHRMVLNCGGKSQNLYIVSNCEKIWAVKWQLRLQLQWVKIP